MEVLSIGGFPLCLADYIRALTFPYPVLATHESVIPPISTLPTK